MVVGYAIFGYYSGMIRRVIGLLTIYAAFLAATNLNTGIAQIILNFSPFVPPADSRLYAYVLVMAVVILAVEGLAAGYNERLQLAVVLMNRLTGLILGAISGVVLMGFWVLLLEGYGSPIGGQLTDNQVKVRTAVTTSALGPAMLNLSKPIRPLFSVALPADPATFFTTAHS